MTVRMKAIEQASYAGWHRDIERWRQVALEAQSTPRSATTIELTAAYLAGAAHKKNGGACGCPNCAEKKEELVAVKVQWNLS